MITARVCLLLVVLVSGEIASSVVYYSWDYGEIRFRPRYYALASLRSDLCSQNIDSIVESVEMQQDEIAGESYSRGYELLYVKLKNFADKRAVLIPKGQMFGILRQLEERGIPVVACS